MAAARQLNYRPSHLARGLSGGRTQSVGVLASLTARTVDDIRNIIAAMDDEDYICHMVDHRSEFPLIAKGSAGDGHAAGRCCDFVSDVHTDWGY